MIKLYSMNKILLSMSMCMQANVNVATEKLDVFNNEKIVLSIDKIISEYANDEEKQQQKQMIYDEMNNARNASNSIMVFSFVVGMLLMYSIKYPYRKKNNEVFLRSCPPLYSGGYALGGEYIEIASKLLDVYRAKINKLILSSILIIGMYTAAVLYYHVQFAKNKYLTRKQLHVWSACMRDWKYHVAGAAIFLFIVINSYSYNPLSDL